MSRKPPASVDAYIAGIQSPEARQALEDLRSTIRREVPEAEEVISYGIPTYKFHGFLCSFAAFKNHCSFFPGHTVRDFSEELKGYRTAKGTIHFPHDRPLPEPLVRSMIRARLTENLNESRKR